MPVAIEDRLDPKIAKVYRTCIDQAVQGDTLPLIETFFSIRSKSSQMVPFKLKPAQRHFWDHRTQNDIVLKAGQLGFSTVTVADFFVDALVVPGLEVLVVAQLDQLAQRMKDAIDNFYLSIPAPLRPPLLVNNQRIMEIDHSAISQGLKSTITVGSAESKTFGRGQPVHRLLATEVAFYEDRSLGVLNGIIARMPVGRSRLVLESTANGEEGFFYDKYWEAVEKEKEGTNAYTAHFYGWNWDPEYIIGIDGHPRWGHPIEEYTPYEQSIRERFDLSDDQLRWYRMQAATLGSDFAKQEFPITDEEAFLPIGASVFSQEQAANASSQVRNPVRVTEDGIEIWRGPEKGRPYILSIDQASGEQRDENERPLDFQVITIWDATTLMQMATFRKREVTAKSVAEMAARLSVEYNDALITPEANLAKFGFVDWLFEYGVSNVYVYIRDGRVRGYGYPVNVATKPALKDNMSDILDIEGGATIHSENLAREVRNYRYLKGRGVGAMGAAPGGHDDELMSTMIAFDPTVREQARMYSGRVKARTAQYTTVRTR